MFASGSEGASSRMAPQAASRGGIASIRIAVGEDGRFAYQVA